MLIDGIGIIAPFDATIEHYMNAQSTPPPVNGTEHSNGNDLAQATGFEAFRPGVPAAATNGGIPRHPHTGDSPHPPNF